MPGGGRRQAAGRRAGSDDRHQPAAAGNLALRADPGRSRRPEAVVGLCRHEIIRARASTMPAIAIVIHGLGVGAAKTNDAIMKLPGAVTLAFTPYGSDPAKLVERARTQGHEVLLQVPMEPFDYPDNDPGPQTLLTNANAEQNIDRLHWHLSRFQGYAGLANFMGSRFVATDAAMQPVIREAGKRGLATSTTEPRHAASPARSRKPGGAVRESGPDHRRGADGGRDRPRAGASWKPWRASAASPWASPPRCRSRSTASHPGPRFSKVAASCLCR